MRKANGLSLIKVREHLASNLSQFLIEADGLSASSGTSARTGHDFDKITLKLTSAQCNKEALSVLETADNCDSDLCITKVHGLHSPALCSVRYFERFYFWVVSRKEVVGGSQRGL